MKLIDLCTKKIQSLPIIDQEHPQKYTEKEEKWLREPLNCEFMNLEEPGLQITFTYGTSKQKEKITLMHGGKYRVPRFIKNHVESKTKPLWKWRPNGEGGMHKENVGSDPRFAMREVYN
jgi:hypothetical protein